MSAAARLIAMATMFASVANPTGGFYYEPAPPTKSQKALFNQPKKLSKKQKAKSKKK